MNTLNCVYRGRKQDIVKDARGAKGVDVLSDSEDFFDASGHTMQCAAHMERAQ